MCGISAIITPYGYDPSLNPPAGSIPPPQIPEDTLGALAKRLTAGIPGAGERVRGQGKEPHVHVEHEQPPVTTNGTHATSAAYRDTLERELKQSLERIEHRGPDGQGIWISDDARVALGHVRLSIRDLSTGGRQPMHAPEQGVHIVVNGEVYDYEPLRRGLEAAGYVFTSTSDSELALFLYLHHGPEEFLLHLRGEFAIIVYDKPRRRIMVARDRYGIKPLYWTVTRSGRILIGAEVKAFLGLGWKPQWDVKSLIDSGWLYDSRTIFQGVHKVCAGHITTFTLDGEHTTKPYWRPSYPSKHEQDPRPFSEMVQGFRTHLIDAVRARLRADVPIGIYLSGGIDSSAIAGIASHLLATHPDLQMGSAERGAPIRCFTIAFDGEGVDESAIARRTAEHLGVDYRVMHASEALLVECFERAVWHVEQPAMDLNFVGKCMLSGFVAAQGYPVVLTGEGADEICAGYSLFLADYLAEQDTTSPSLAIEPDELARQRNRIAKLRHATQPNAFNPPVIDFPGKQTALESIGGTWYPQLQSAGIWDPRLFAPWTRSLGDGNPVTTQIQDLDPLTRRDMREAWHPLHNALYLSVKGPMEGLILTSLGDRTEMCGSLESRPSFLDHHLTEYANNLPPSAKITVAPDGTVVEKYVLREATREFITPELYKRRKHPYAAPVTYRAGSAVHTLITGHVTRANMEMLGFVNVKEALRLVKEAFEEGGTNAFRKCLVLAEYVVLHRAFGMETARMPGAL